MKHATIDSEEICKFSQLARDWWSLEGPLKTLHDINPLRLSYIERYVDLKGQRVLDIGCGGGILAESMAEQGALVTGLDMADEAIAVAKQHAEQAQWVIDYRCQPLASLSEPPYPIVCCLEMLEHVPEPQRLLEEAARLLAPNGYLFLSTLNRTPKAYASAVLAAEYILGLLPKQTHDYQRFIKPSELAKMLRNIDLEIVGLSGLAYYPWSRSAELSASVDVNYLMVARSLP